MRFSASSLELASQPEGDGDQRGHTAQAAEHGNAFRRRQRASAWDEGEAGAEDEEYGEPEGDVGDGELNHDCGSDSVGWAAFFHLHQQPVDGDRLIQAWYREPFGDI